MFRYFVETEVIKYEDKTDLQSNSTLNDYLADPALMLETGGTSFEIHPPILNLGD